MFEEQAGLGRRQVHRLGDQQPLRLDLPPLHPAPQLFVQDPLVKRVLVDDHHAVAGLGDQIAVVDLDRLAPSAPPRRLNPVVARRNSPADRAIEEVAGSPARFAGDCDGHRNRSAVL